MLWTQGSSPVSQPLVDEDGNILLWNGDIFAGPLVSAKIFPFLIFGVLIGTNLLS